MAAICLDPRGVPQHASEQDVIAAFNPLLRRYAGTDAAALRSIGWTSGSA